MTAPLTAPTALDVDALVQQVQGRLQQREGLLRPEASASAPATDDGRFYELKRNEAYNHHRYGAFGREIQQKRGGWKGRVEFFFKRVVRKLLGWYVRPQIEFNASVTRAVAETVKHFEAMQGELAALRAENGTLRDELAQFKEALAARERLAIDYHRFEARFRGPREQILAAQRPYAALFAGQTNVLDIGCGRGEFLELLREAGIDAYGVDQDGGMLSEARHNGLKVVEGDAFAHLALLPDASLGGIYLGQVVEHFGPPDLYRLLSLAAAKLRPGAVLIAETPNTICEPALRTFYLDPTHVRPLHPELLRFLAEEAGLAFDHFVFTSAMPGYAPERRAIAEALEREDVSQYRDYAVVMRKI